ncbi:putative tap domain-containing protein [Phaeomoniella chlamydospora]|uniref:Putative tap domain-containing protein n=1 Tax=Phaeomoniella chlamydospora TaxID=158046 RepID=A0A0G2E8H3_PHACM|nr:putative tap domain-containing protein [Phaeomoniella chlamydospora]
MPYSCDIPDDLDNDDVVFWTQSQSTIQQQLDLNTQIFSACQASNPVQGTLVGTSFVARDMMQLVDALGGDGLLRYVGTYIFRTLKPSKCSGLAGVSYGTLIGDTVAAMFPDRMGRVILDGNVDPIDYYHGEYVQALLKYSLRLTSAYSYADNFDDTDLALAAFFDGCAKYPNLCNLTSASNMTGAQLEQQFLDHMDLLAKGNYSGPDAVQVERVTFSSLYHPNQYRSLSASLQKTYNRITPTTTTNTTRRSLDPITNPPTKTLHQRAAEASFIFKAIRCGDGRFGGVNLTVSDMEAILEDYDPYDEKFLLEVVAANVKSCANWPQRAKEIYSGNFNVQTKHGILYINSPYDPITPYSSAEKASALFPGSVILTHNGYGVSHSLQPTSSLAYPSH